MPKGIIGNILVLFLRSVLVVERSTSKTVMWIPLWVTYHTFLVLVLWMVLHFMLLPSLLLAASNQINQKFIAQWSFQMLTLPSKIFQGSHISILKRGHHNFKCVHYLLHWTSYNFFSLFTIINTNLYFTEGQMNRPPM